MSKINKKRIGQIMITVGFIGIGIALINVLYYYIRASSLSLPYQLTIIALVNIIFIIGGIYLLRKDATNKSKNETKNTKAY